MNLDSLVKQGHLPWRPKPEAHDLDVWHGYETPLTGTFRVDRSVIMFTQVLESSHGLSAWAYLPLQQNDVDQVSDITFDSVDDMRDFVANFFSGKEAVLTLARGNRILDQWTRCEVTDGLVPAVETFLNGIIKSVDQVTDTDKRVRAKLAGFEAASSELVDA